MQPFQKADPADNPQVRQPCALHPLGSPILLSEEEEARLRWLFSRYPVQRFYHLDLAVLGWSMRGAMLLFGGLGLLAEVYYFGQLTSWASLFLTVTVSIVFFADALIAEEPVPAAVGGVDGRGAPVRVSRG